MSKRKLTPTLNLKGRYTFIHPFITNSLFQYQCIAIRSFRDVVEDGEDVYSRYYLPMSISETDYQQDVSLDANIITLLRSDNSLLYIPDTYIESYPNLDAVGYKNLALGIGIGPIPDYVDLTGLIERIKGNVSDLIGVTGKVEEYAVPFSGTITPAEHESLEVARVAAIHDRETLYATNYRLNQELVDARVKIRALEKIITDNGYS